MRFLATLFRNLSRHAAVERDLDEEVHAHSNYWLTNIAQPAWRTPLHDGRLDWSSVGLGK